MPYPNHKQSGWYIYDGDSVYIHRAFPSKDKAELAIIDLLKPYPQDNEWHQRLNAREKTDAES